MELISRFNKLKIKQSKIEPINFQMFLEQKFHSLKTVNVNCSRIIKYQNEMLAKFCQSHLSIYQVNLLSRMSQNINRWRFYYNVNLYLTNIEIAFSGVKYSIMADHCSIGHFENLISFLMCILNGISYFHVLCADFKWWVW